MSKEHHRLSYPVAPCPLCDGRLFSTPDSLECLQCGYDSSTTARELASYTLAGMAFTTAAAVGAVHASSLLVQAVLLGAAVSLGAYSVTEGVRAHRLHQGDER